MDDLDLTLLALHLAWGQYRARDDASPAPSSFLRWLHRHRPELLAEVGAAGVRRFFSQSAVA